MAKTKEELNKLKKDYEDLSNKLQELSQDELDYIAAGTDFSKPDGPQQYDPHFYHGGIKDFDN